MTEDERAELYRLRNEVACLLTENERIGRSLGAQIAELRTKAAQLDEECGAWQQATTCVHPGEVAIWLRQEIDSAVAAALREAQE